MHSLCVLVKEEMAENALCAPHTPLCCSKFCPLRDRLLTSLPLLSAPDYSKEGMDWIVQDGGGAFTPRGSLSAQISYPLLLILQMLMGLLMLARWTVLCYFNTWNCGHHSQTQHSIAFNILSYLLISTESQNHRMVGVGRDLCGSSSPYSLHTGLWNLCRREDSTLSHYLGSRREVGGSFHRITESQNGRGWKGPLWDI